VDGKESLDLMFQGPCGPMASHQEYGALWARESLQAVADDRHIERHLIEVIGVMDLKLG
jgi:hypothetical protein